MLRTPLGPRDGNARKGKDLTPYQRGIIIGSSKIGGSPAAIAKAYQIPDSTVRTTLARAAQRNDTGASRPRSGRPKAVSDRDERHIIRLVKTLPEINYATIREHVDLNCSRSTIYRVLKDFGITNWLAKDRPKLTEEHAATRLAWAKKHKDWTLEQWKAIIWSDECSVEQGSGKKRLWVFRTPKQKWLRKMVNEKPKKKGISVMV